MLFPVQYKLFLIIIANRIASGDRNKHCRSVARSPNHNQSYDQAIVRSGVTVALQNMEAASTPLLGRYVSRHSTYYVDYYLNSSARHCDGLWLQMSDTSLP